MSFQSQLFILRGKRQDVKKINTLVGYFEIHQMSHFPQFWAMVISPARTASQTQLIMLKLLESCMRKQATQLGCIRCRFSGIRRNKQLLATNRPKSFVCSIAPSIKKVLVPIQIWICTLRSLENQSTV